MRDPLITSRHRRRALLGAAITFLPIAPGKARLVHRLTAGTNAVLSHDAPTPPQSGSSARYVGKTRAVLAVATAAALLVTLSSIRALRRAD